jgi:hypothetical protein
MFDGCSFADLLVDAADFPTPPPALAMGKIHDAVVGPMQVIGNEGYLLIDTIEGVAYDPPGWLMLVSTAVLHSGHLV